MFDAICWVQLFIGMGIASAIFAAWYWGFRKSGGG